MSKVITALELDLSDLPATSETRDFVVSGLNGAMFSLEIKNEDSYYYNFTTKAFQVARARLDKKTITENGFEGSITFPAISDNDHYNIYMWAEDGTVHAAYNEVRFGDDSIDINSSTGSDSLFMQKIIYQYTNLTLTLDPFSPNAVSDLIKTSSKVSNAITIASGGTKSKSAFTISCEVNAATKSYRIIKQPTSDDILSFISPTVGSAPVTLPGEDIYPAVSNTDDVNGDVVIETHGTTVTMETAVASKVVVGDRVTGNTALDGKIVTATALTGTYTFTLSEAVAIATGTTLSFSNRMNYQWPLDNYVHLIKEDMIVTGSNVESGTTIGKYEDIETIFEDTEEQQTIIKNKAPSSSTAGNKPIITNGRISTQAGDIIFNKQQPLALAGDGVRIGGYGVDEVLRVYGYEIVLSDLEVALTSITTTTTAASNTSTSVVVAERSGILDNVSTVSGIGINPTAAAPTVSSGAGSVSGAGTIVLSAVQTLENGITLTFDNAGLVATVTGNIEVLKVGTADATIRFDMEKLISIT